MILYSILSMVFIPFQRVYKFCPGVCNASKEKSPILLGIYYIFWMRITRELNLAMFISLSVCPYFRLTVLSSVRTSVCLSFHLSVHPSLCCNANVFQFRLIYRLAVIETIGRFPLFVKILRTHLIRRTYSTINSNIHVYKYIIFI